jgi:uroporphyrinogen-III decarboxylase
MEKNGAELSPVEKRKERFDRWLSPPGVTFSNPEAEEGYKERVTRFIRAFQLQIADRVPCILPASNYAAYYAGTDLQTVMYDYDKLAEAWLKFFHDFKDDLDSYIPPALVPPGRALELVDYRLYRWPGHGISGDTTSYQCVEAEYMKADEYDALIRDPSDFWLRTYLPRIFGVFKAFSQLPPWTSFEEIAIQSFVPFGNPDIQAGFKALLDAGTESLKWLGKVGEVAVTAAAEGIPGIMSGLAKAPFDTLGDTLRGTQGVMMDMFQRPDKLHEAMERITPLTIRSAINGVNAGAVPVVMMPLHKGADGFMSDKQYEAFYWPTFKKVIMALVEEGIMVILFAEGSYNTRFDYIKELPKGATAWWFDQTDIARAKKELGDVCCIMGNVPTSLMMTGTPQEVKEHCRKLIEVCGKDGGYILCGGANIDKGPAENMRAMMAAAREYGAYK